MRGTPWKSLGRKCGYRGLTHPNPHKPAATPAGRVNVNAWLVRHGYALAYRRYSTKYIPEEDQAKAAPAGIWAGEFVPPWDWRRGKRLP